jgi:hypothetical protein
LSFFVWTTGHFLALFVEGLSATERRRAMIRALAISASREQTSPPPLPRLFDVLQQATAERGHPVEMVNKTVILFGIFAPFLGPRGRPGGRPTRFVIIGRKLAFFASSG